MDAFSALLALCVWDSNGHSWILSQRASYAEFWCFSELSLNKRLKMDLEVIWDAMTLMWRLCNVGRIFRSARKQRVKMIKVWTKWPPVCRRHFQCFKNKNHRVFISPYFYFNFIDFFFLKVQSTTSQNWLRQWLGPEQPTSHPELL